MRFLLDTHLLLWVIVQSPKLSKDVVGILEDTTNIIAASSVSVWEAAIKYKRRRGRPDDMPLSGVQLLEELSLSDTPIVSVTARHAAMIDDLPMHHRDPFDRMLVVQAQSESMTLLTHDRVLMAYGDFVRIV